MAMWRAFYGGFAPVGFVLSDKSFGSCGRSRKDKVFSMSFFDPEFYLFFFPRLTIFTMRYLSR